ncbi:uncharacterized protein BDR25DRAFT_358394 [Lindgomyces ingoldianus]|uniref:Uncharacterized protein n=1 Tax=Lindgomyces ingoldianus TaxID=673940 RepID=A0ACB6QMA2_9PLEO|nr:uncharacterized protein BDR25DRAFT_358394 [Lindgomyces ingoldianus]KAF2467708.1 hypothetical protein BDR25DRAFT_358394 [Lindgomyces ingoldianus]
MINSDRSNEIVIHKMCGTLDPALVLAVGATDITRIFFRKDEMPGIVNAYMAAVVSIAMHSRSLSVELTSVVDLTALVLLYCKNKREKEEVKIASLFCKTQDKAAINIWTFEIPSVIKGCNFKNILVQQQQYGLEMVFELSLSRDIVSVMRHGYEIKLENQKARNHSTS